VAYGDQSIALDVAPTNFNIASPLEAAATLRAADTANQGAQTANATAATQLQMLGRQSSAQDIDYRNELIRNAAAHAQDADSWDRAMKQAAAQGAPEAQQYIGRYTPLLQQRLFESYGGGQPATATPGTAGSAAPAAGASGLAAAATPGNDLDRVYANVSPAQMATSLQRLNMVNDALMQVRDPQSWDAAIKSLAAAGIPQAQQFAGAYSPLRVQQLWNAIQPAREYLQNRVLQSSTGQPAPLITPNVKEAGGGLYQVNPTPTGTGGVTELVPPSQRAQWAGTTPDNKPIVLDTRTGDMLVDGKPYSGPINAKPSAGANTWQVKYRAALALHPNDPDLAMQIANGQKGMSPADMRRAAIALAQKDAENLSLAGTPPADMKTFMAQKTQEHFNELASPMPGTTPTTPGAPAAAPAPAPTALPPRARALLKEGVNQTFANNQVWTLRGGKPVRVK
jgi:hypothetical protein